MNGDRHTPGFDAVLFDIDGTLLVDSSAHLAVLADTLSRRVSSRVDIDLDGEVPRLDGRGIAGWIDAQVVRFVLAERTGSPVTDADLRDVIDDYGNAYRKMMQGTVRAGRTVEGAGACLERLRVAGIRLGLVTGNASVIARTKLEAVGLASYFEFDRDLGFGDWRSDRAAIALAAVGRMQLPPTSAGNVVIVGDTPTDMRAALAAGARPIGVTTGAATERELYDAGATLVLASVADIPDSSDGSRM